ncbi:MAG: Hsp33 family molecular chaperone HslO [Ruminococcaceae bacterium]|nr:Hsp33 family molecular chaperone HslO [Oscillospiraceae bacterium]
MDNMVRALSESGGIVVCALDSTEVVKEMERLHQPSAVVSAGLGRLLTAASLMGSWLKNPQDSLTLRIDGGGPAGVLVAVSDGDANVRGYAGNNVVEIPLRADGKLDVGGAVGHEGTLSVMKDLGMKEPYIGQTPLVSGEIAEDITAYYAASEQTPTVCALGVLVNADLSIRRAGGFLLQLMPGALEEEITAVEKNVAEMLSVTDLLENGGTPEDMVHLALKGLGPEILEKRTVEYRCTCSRERTQDILASLGADELEAMRQENPAVQVECHFCNKVYEFDINGISQKIK